MEPDELDRYAAEFEAFHARFAHFFGRRERRETARQYLRGLLAQGQRKNCWQMAEAVGAADPQSLQRLLYSTPWETGLDEYEVRYWHSWHRHVTLSMMARAWLAAIRQPVGEKPAGLGTGRAERARSAAALGSRPAAASALLRTATGLVALAPRQTAAGVPQSLSQAKWSLVREWYP